MNNKISKIQCIAIFLAGISTALIPAVANATLESRLGGQAFYDTGLDISWLADANMNGEQTWQTQMTWADNLIIAGTDGWRLPSVGELYYLHSIEQIRHPFMGIEGEDPFPFTNISWTYWTNHSFDNHLAYTLGLSFGPGNPLLEIALKSHNALAAWAVHDGDVDQLSLISQVPEPETYAMLLAGLGLLGFMARRRKESAI